MQRKNILIVGCSFSYQSNNENAWPDWLRKKYNDKLYVVNLSIPGASNELIKRILTTNLLIEKWDYVIIQWSTIDRWDYPITYDKNPMFVEYCKNGSNLQDKRKYFYKHYYSVYGAVIDTLENILFTQQLLDSENIAYKMITIGNLFSLSTTFEQIKNLIKMGGDYYGLQENVLEKMEKISTLCSNSDSIPFLLKKINYDKFLFTDNVRNPMGGGMLEWLYKEKNDYPKNNWHFNGEQSKEFLNEFILPNILVKNNLL
jgi:hypothetical protein